MWVELYSSAITFRILKGFCRAFRSEKAVNVSDCSMLRSFSKTYLQTCMHWNIIFKIMVGSASWHESFKHIPELMEVIPAFEA